MKFGIFATLFTLDHMNRSPSVLLYRFLVTFLR